MRLLLHKIPARHGTQWIRQGWQVFRQAPLPLAALLCAYLIAWLLMSLLGMLGAVLMLGSLPLLSLVHMIATHQVLQKRAIGFAIWAQPFKLTRQRLHAQLQLGLLYVICTSALMLLAHALDGGALERVQLAMAKAGADEDATRAAEAVLNAELANPAFLWALLLRLGGAALISVPFWHAPALVHWGGHGALKALFSSCLGLWTNRAAFLLNGLAWLAILLGGSLLLSLVFGLLGTPALATATVFPLVLLCSTVFYCGLYFTFVDCFRFAAEESSEPKPATS
jgi:hypothetical protein